MRNDPLEWFEEIFFSPKKIPFPFRDENILMKLGNFARCYGNTIRRKAGNVKLKKKRKRIIRFCTTSILFL